MDFGGGDEIRFERLGKAGVVTLTRPAALNSITHRMVNALRRALDSWESDPDVATVIVKADGRAFSAGGDIQQVYEAGRAGRPPVQFFADEYRLNTRIAQFKKPYLALIDGIVMGGGVGISVHGSCRAMTENALFAMPEVGIGFFPDVGGSYFLPRLKGSFGIYLALTGTRIRRGDACWSGLATHSVSQASLPEALAAIAESGLPGEVLKRLSTPPAPETDEATFHAISRHFSLGSLEGILASLEQAAPSDAFAAKTLAIMKTKSPTSLQVTFRQMAAGAMLSIEECMAMEFRILRRMVEGHDFYEGIRAAVIDKGSPPRWKPASLADIDPAEIDLYFAPLDDGELVL